MSLEAPTMSKADKEREQRFETERDMETMTRMQEILADKERLKRVTEMVSKQEKTIKNMSQLKSAIAEKQKA